MARPNILLITSDQQRADYHGFRNPTLRTPLLEIDWGTVPELKLQDRVVGDRGP